MKRLKITAMRYSLLFFVFVLLFTFSYGKEKWKPDRDFVKAKVVRVVDGDTIVVSIPKTTFNNRKTLKNLRFNLRLIGIDTPESKPNRRAKIQSKETDKDVKTIVKLGKKAKAFTKNLVKGYRYVFLEFDLQPQDRYGRLLAYVWLPDGRMLNKEIICNGYAYPLTIPPNIKYKDQFLKCFHYARENKLGLWR